MLTPTELQSILDAFGERRQLLLDRLAQIDDKTAKRLVRQLTKDSLASSPTRVTTKPSVASGTISVGNPSAPSGIPSSQVLLHKKSKGRPRKTTKTSQQTLEEALAALRGVPMEDLMKLSGGKIS